MFAVKFVLVYAWLYSLSLTLLDFPDFSYLWNKYHSLTVWFLLFNGVRPNQVYKNVFWWSKHKWSECIFYINGTLKRSKLQIKIFRGFLEEGEWEMGEEEI